MPVYQKKRLKVLFRYIVIDKNNNPNKLMLLTNFKINVK